MKKIEMLKCPLCGTEMNEEEMGSSSNQGETFETRHDELLLLVCPNCHAKKIAIKKFILDEYNFVDEEEKEEYDYLYKEYLMLNGGNDIIFFDSFDEKIPYRNFLSEYDEEAFLEEVYSFIIKTDAGVDFAKKLFPEKNFKKGFYQYSLDTNDFESYESELASFNNRWEHLLELN